MSRINIIVAASTNNVIGKNGDLPWRLPTDLKRFKEITKGHPVYMGRSSWDSIPPKYRPLPERDNFVFTRNTDFVAEGATVLHNLKTELLKLKNDGEDKDVFIIGGGHIYKTAFPFAEKLYLTLVHANVDGDTFLDGFIEGEWQCGMVEGGASYNENGFQFSFKEYFRK